MATKTYRIHQGGALLEGLGEDFPQAKSPADFGPLCALIRVIHALPKGVKPRNAKLYGGVAGKIVARPKGDTLMLASRSEPATIFCYDGSVWVVEFIDNEPEVRRLAPQDALQARLDDISENLWNLANDPELDFNEEELCRIEDKLLHEVAEMLERAGGNLDLRKQIVAFGEQVMSEMHIRGGVHNHFRRVFDSFGDHTIYGWLATKSDDSLSDLSNVIAFPSNQRPAVSPLSRGGMKTKLSRAEIEDRRKKSRGNRLTLQTPKGASGGESKHGSAKKKTGKK